MHYNIKIEINRAVNFRMEYEFYRFSHTFQVILQDYVNDYQKEINTDIHHSEVFSSEKKDTFEYI